MKTYREVKVSERMPNKTGDYFVNTQHCEGKGMVVLFYAGKKTHSWGFVYSWLEEIEQPICKSCEASSKLLAQLSDEDKKEIIENGEDVYIRVSKEKIEEIEQPKMSAEEFEDEFIVDLARKYANLCEFKSDFPVIGTVLMMDSLRVLKQH